MRFKFCNWLVVATSAISLVLPWTRTAGLSRQERKQDSAGASVLKDGTLVQLRLKEGVSSELAQVGDNVACIVADDVKVDDLVVIRRGTVAPGVVTEARRKGMWHGGRLSITVKSVRLADGEEVPLRLARITVAGSSSAPFPGLANQGDVKPGEEIIGIVNGDFPIDTEKLKDTSSGQAGAPVRGPSAAAEPKAAPADPAGEPATVVLRTTPDAADIIVDGKFMGTTPATLRIPAGDHKISLEKSGFVPWQRTMTATEGSTQTLNATLQEEAP